MRKKYIHILKKKVIGGHIGWLIQQGYKRLALPISQLINCPLCGPLIGGLLVTYRCNSRCLMCDLWRRAQKETRREFSTNEFKKIIDGFKAIGVSGIGLDGGEPFLREDIFEVIAYMVKKGIPVSCPSNGHLFNDDLAQKLVISGLDTISFSLDGSNSTIHDYLRGMKGSFDRVVKAIGLINYYRRKLGKRINLTVATAISSVNFAEVSNIIKLVQDLGVDGLSFTAVDLSGYGESREEKEKELLAPIDRKIKNELFEELLALKRGIRFIDNSENYIKLIRDYYFERRPLPIKCLAAYTSLIVDCYGDVYPCFGYEEMKQKVGTIKADGVRNFWYLKEYRKKRPEILRCRKCFFSCQMELNFIYEGLPKKEDLRNESPNNDN